MKTNISELNKDIAKKVSLLICSSSFEERWYQVAQNIISDRLKHIVILHKTKESAWQRGINRIDEAHGNIYEITDINKFKPADLWKEFSQNLLPLIQEQEYLTLIDITTLTHEAVVLFVYLIKMNNLSDKVVLTYSGADKYMNSNNQADWWLSRGVKEIRSILGFPGLVRPSKKSHLIILVGFETERAKELILRYEPKSLSLGLGVEPYSQEFLDKNIWYREQLEAFLGTVASSVKIISEFEFSCSDYESAKDAILSEADKFPNCNITIAPMNTKVSTVAAASAAIENESLKLCYVEPIEYNKTSYSSPADTLTVINFKD